MTHRFVEISGNRSMVRCACGVKPSDVMKRAGVIKDKPVSLDLERLFARVIAEHASSSGAGATIYSCPTSF